MSGNMLKRKRRGRDWQDNAEIPHRTARCDVTISVPRKLRSLLHSTSYNNPTVPSFSLSYFPLPFGDTAITMRIPETIVFRRLLHRHIDTQVSTNDATPNGKNTKK